HSRDVCDSVSGAQYAEHHGPAHAAVRDSFGSDFQRFDHHRADSARVEGREVPADERGGAVATQLANLRARRNRRAVCGNQADRRCDSRDRTGLSMKNLVTAILMTVVTTILLGLIYPLIVTGLAQVIFPDQANGQLIRNADG